VLFGRKMSHARHERLPERPIISPFGQDFVDGRIVNGRLPLGVCRHRQALPRHPRLEYPQAEVEDAVITPLALRSTRGHGEVREDTCVTGCEFCIWSEPIVVSEVIRFSSVPHHSAHGALT
jgi:hypothetical protein